MDSNQNTTITTPLTVFAGTLVHSTRTVPLQIVNDALIGVRGKTIIFIESQSDLNDLARRYFFNPKDVRYMKQSQFLIPGFVDTHIHAPQYAISGSGMDLQLLDWLEKYTFPTEMKYNNTKFAENVYEKVVDRTLKWGTTTACYYGTIHTKSTLILADVIDKAGQRAFVGKVNMDQNSPENYMEDIQTSIQETER
ncbi:guanine deaminase-like [Saccoglossus kowalevskii]